MKKITLILTAILLFAFSTSAFAQKGLGGPACGERGDRLENILQLNNSQQEQFEKLRFEHQKASLDLRNQIEKNILEISQMMRTNKIDPEKLVALTSSNSNLKSSIQESRVKMWLDVYKILDDTQKEKWAEGFARFGQEGMHGKKGRGMRPDRQGREDRMNMAPGKMRRDF